ncbi:apolipoprotein L3-like isoform X9 [Sander lucioperca]|uniref:apolipoprotein L3-like isoform X9 n=1 Tax=Sander lucioperca TaxID=283035 RepID=UPI001653E436|nr:apolipoprotein L3-like isoform X9 [Sander lucioperca]
MRGIKDRADNIDLSIGNVRKSKNKGKAFWEYMKSKATQVTADSRRAELETELAAVLKDTLRGLEKLNCFLDAVENLAVTSLHVFMEENQVLHLPEGISPEHVQVVISAARRICPHLLEFKRDASVFFLPKLQNVEVLAYQLEKYIKTTQIICEKLEKSSFSDFCLEMNDESLVDLDVDLSEDDVQRMLHHINQLDEIRMNQSFRTVFFSSVGAVGGVLSIIGLALIPVTAGASLVLTMTGVGLGITSGVNSAVTTATEIGVNRTQQKKASEVFQSFMEDVQDLQDCLKVEIKEETSPIDVVVGVGKVLGKAGAIGKGIDSIVDAASAVKMLKTEELIASAGKVVVQEGKALRNVPRVAADIPDIGQAAVKGPLALSKSARAGLIGLNALFLGMDIFFICKDSISLAKGSKTEVSQFIRARTALWSSELDSWQKIHDFLCEGRLTSEENKAILETPFYPEKEMKKEKTEMEINFDEVDEEQKIKEKQIV